MRTALLACVLAAASLLTGCGMSVYRPPGSANLDLHPDTEINDEDVRKAFEAKPQLPGSLKVGYFSVAPEKADDIDKMVRSIPGVTDVYRIPGLLMTGERRWANEDPFYYHNNNKAQPISVKKLRLMAARAHCDIVLLFDYGNKYQDYGNGWLATSILVLPLLFTPWQNTTSESYLDAYMLDVRNGYLYAHTTTERKETSGNHTIYYNASTEALAKQWTELLADTKKAVIQTIDVEKNKAPTPMNTISNKPAPSTTPAVPPPPVDPR